MQRVGGLLTGTLHIQAYLVSGLSAAEPILGILAYNILKIISSKHMHLTCCSSTRDNIRRTNPREEGLWEAKNNVHGLVTEDGGIYCWIWRSKDVGTRQIKLASM